MTVDGFVNALAYAIVVGGLSLLAYPLITGFFIARSALTSARLSWLDFSLSLLIMAGFIASISFSNRYVSEGPYRPDVSDIFYPGIIFLASLAVLMSNFLRLFSEQKGAFRRLFITQGVLGAMFMEALAWILVIDSTWGIGVDYLLIVAVMALAATMNCLIHVRHAEFPRSRASVLQAATVTAAVIAPCCWIIVVDWHVVNWYGSALICFCFF